MYECKINIIILLIALCLFITTVTQAQNEDRCGPLATETILLSTDRSIYLAGEMIYVSATVLESDNYYISRLSKIVRFELINSEAKTGIRNILSPLNGTAAGTIRLPGNLPTGWYRLRAYTSWMRNSEPSSFSYRDIRVINSSDADRLHEYTLHDTLLVSVIAGNGTALTGEPNRCAIRSITLHGRPLPVEGLLLSRQNDTVAQFSTGDAGWGTIVWNPGEGMDYSIKLISDPGIPVIVSIPDHTVNAVTVNISEYSSPVKNTQKEDTIIVALKGDIPVNGVKLLVHRTSTRYLYRQATPVDGKISLKIPVEDLPDGLFSFSFLDNDNNKIASLLWIKGDPLSGSGSVITKPVVGLDSTHININYHTEGIGHYIITTRRREPAETGNIFMAALPGWKTTWDIPVKSSERDGWLIANSYEGRVPESFFKPGNTNPSTPIINFRDITRDRESKVDFLPETRGYTLSGKATYANNEPAGYLTLSLTGLNDNIFKTTCVFPDGSYYFALEDIEGSKDLLLSVTSREAANIKLSVNPDFEPLTGPVPLKNIYLTDQEIKYVRDMITDYRLENIYRDTTLIMTDRDSSIPDTGSIFYGNPDRVIFIDDYIKLPDMRELIFEVVKEITVRKNVDDYIIKVIGEEPMPRIYNPLILIDGIPLLSYSRFLDLPPERFRKIDIINSLYIHGNQGFAGVVNFISMNGDMAGLDLPEVSRVLSLSLPGPTISGEIINTTLYNSDFPFLSRTLSYFSFSGPADGSLTIKLNPLYDDYITILSGISYNKKWLSVSSPFEINGFLIR